MSALVKFVPDNTLKKLLLEQNAGEIYAGIVFPFCEPDQRNSSKVFIVLYVYPRKIQNELLLVSLMLSDYLRVTDHRN